MCSAKSAVLPIQSFHANKYPLLVHLSWASVICRRRCLWHTQTQQRVTSVNSPLYKQRQRQQNDGTDMTVCISPFICSGGGGIMTMADRIVAEYSWL